MVYPGTCTANEDLSHLEIIHFGELCMDFFVLTILTELYSHEGCVIADDFFFFAMSCLINGVI